MYVTYVNIDLCRYKIISTYEHLYTLSLAASGDIKVIKTKQTNILRSTTALYIHVVLHFEAFSVQRHLSVLAVTYLAS